ncbi:MAG: TIGR04283 family arsenosugar biosynthesis glycosyltransferase [Chloroflexi bacterium]|nr:TIGR04283 family arsenosugar biosynthesis glycosyltransferase [Chloroflexota bacterium]
MKTRLIPALGAEGAAALHRQLVLRTLRTAHALCQSQDAELEIRFAGDDASRMQQWLGDSWVCRPQCGGDLGRRMAGAFEDSFREGSPATIIIGSDCPSLTPEVLAAAFDALKTNSVVFGPATDGGYYLIGLAKLVPALFQNVAWGTETVIARSLEILARSGNKPTLLKPLDDLDRPDDLSGWRKSVEAEDADLSRVSVIISALNEAAYLTAALQSVRAGSPHEIIVVDGGSTDDTRNLAQSAGATVIQSRSGRARQMNAGAARATGSVLLFLHADTLLSGDYLSAVSEALHEQNVAAGAFRFRIGGNLAGKWIVEWTTNLRSRWGQMPYGDQGLFLRQSLFAQIGGFADVPIMEDYELVRRLRHRGRIVTVSQTATTSGRRWRRRGFLRTTAINKLIIFGFRCGVAPERLAALYRG